MKRSESPEGPSAALSPREISLLKLILRGMQNKEIAYELGLSVSTVKGYIRHLNDGLSVQNRSELGVWALSHTQALTGKTVAVARHRQGCPCFEPYCHGMRIIEQKTHPIGCQCSPHCLAVSILHQQIPLEAA